MHIMFLTYFGGGGNVPLVVAVLRMWESLVLYGFINMPKPSYIPNFKYIRPILRMLWYLQIILKFHDFKR